MPDRASNFQEMVTNNLNESSEVNEISSLSIDHQQPRSIFSRVNPDSRKQAAEQ